jgi:hypothetical protein
MIHEEKECSCPQKATQPVPFEPFNSSPARKKRLPTLPPKPIYNANTVAKTRAKKEKRRKREELINQAIHPEVV